MYTVDEDATLVPTHITVSTDATDDKDDAAIDDVALTVTVAGPVGDYMLDGSTVIDLGGAAKSTRSPPWT